MVGNGEIPPVNVTAMNTRIIPIEFDYYEPKTLDEALELLDKFGEKAKILAGGTDLLVKIKARIIEPRVIINIKKILGLRYIREEEKVIRIGALTRLRDLERSDIIKKYLPALYDAVKVMGSIQIRNMGTIGGNLCNASPAADTAPPLLVYDARAVIASVDGERVVPLEEFFVGPGKTVLKPNEMLKEIIVEKPSRGSSAFKKVSRVAVDLAIASSAVYLVVEDGVIKEARIALGSVAPKPVRARKTENAVKGLRVGSEELRSALNKLEEEISPITDVRSTAEYRRYVVKVLTWDSLHKAYERLSRGGVYG
ncbi:MAG: xanthine dehydrogenase family protein subunit M [Thermoprotei archaeon]